VFTIPNERMLIPDMQSYLDKATETVLALGKAQDSKAPIIEAEHKLGRATIRAIYGWAHANAFHKTGAAVEWRRSDSVRRETIIQAPEFVALSESLDRISRTEEITITPAGTLVGADTKYKTFHFVTVNDEDMRGRFSDVISESQAAQLPGRYIAVLRKTTQISYATEEEKSSYFLEGLESLR